MTTEGLTPGVFDPTALAEADPAFPREEYLGRVEKLRALAADAGIDLLWITTPDTVCWLHGFFASWYKGNGPMRYPQCYGTALHTGSGRFVHFDNPTERAVAARTSICEDYRWLPDREPAPNLRFVMDELNALGWLGGSVGVELWSYVPNRAVGSMFDGAFRSFGCRIVDASALVRGARRVKSPREIACIEKAMAICDVGHRTVRERLEPGMTELELFGQVTAAMMAEGGEFPALIPIFNAVPVVDGRPGLVGHGMAGRKVLREGELLAADLCGVYHRYHANAMRGYYVGGDPPPALRERYRLAGGVFEVFESEIRAGMTVREVNARLRAYYEEAGLRGRSEGWALGYELGLSLPPDWVGDFYFHVDDERYLERVFEPGMVTNFESLFSTALIDTIVYEPEGCRVLSKTPLEVIAVG